MKNDRIYIRIDADLKQQAQAYAADTGRTLAGLIEWLLREELKQADSLKRGGQGRSKKMKKWSLKKIEDGRSEYISGDEKIVITNAAYDSGCFDLKRYEGSKLTGKAFWHGSDMDIGSDFDFVSYFSADSFPDCLNYVDWEPVDK